MVPALVLTAGLATRLRPLSLVRAKAALPVGGVPLIHRILRSLATAGVRDVVLNLHHLPHTLTGCVGDGSDLGLTVRYSWETPVLGSAGGPRRAIPLLPGQPLSTFLIVNGDTLTDLDLGALVDAHRHSGALVTLAVVPNSEPDRYGGVVAGPDGTVTGFVARGSRQPSHHFVGVQVAEAQAFDTVPPGVPHESVGQLYPALLRSRPGSMRVYQTGAAFVDIGTPADYLRTALLFAEREAGLVVPRATVSPAARVERSVLWDDVVVEGGAYLRECVVTDGVTVPADTSWRGVSIRLATGELAPGERRVDGLAIGGI